MADQNPNRALRYGLGAGVAGALFLALKYAIRKPTKLPVPDTISPAIFKTKVMHTSLGQIVYHESGAGRPMVFIHDFLTGGSSYEWSKVYPEFALGQRVLALDLIGFGESARPKRTLSIADYARALAEFLRATTDAPAILVGSGLGAGLCVYLASQHPELAERLLLFAPTGLAEANRPRTPLGLRLISFVPLLHRFVYRNYQSTRAAIEAWLANEGFADPAKLTLETIDVFTTCAQQFNAEHAALNLHSGALRFDLAARMKALAQPAHVFWPDDAPAPPAGWNATPLHRVRLLAALEDPRQIRAALEEQLDPALRVYRPA